MVKRSRTRHGKKRKTNILKRTAFKTLKNLNNKLMKKINLLTRTKRRKHKHRGGG
jgi:hypothetical protein